MSTYAAPTRSSEKSSAMPAQAKKTKPSPLSAPVLAVNKDVAPEWGPPVAQSWGSITAHVKQSSAGEPTLKNPSLIAPRKMSPTEGDSDTANLMEPATLRPVGQINPQGVSKPATTRQASTGQPIQLQAQRPTLQRKPESAAGNAQAVAKPVEQSPTPNKTGLPNHLKAGIERLSGYSMDDVQVHYNSAKPAQLQAHAYTQGTEIHLAPQQEKHLPHEAWHVVQQKQGRVKPIGYRVLGKTVNANTKLEQEADRMGLKAAITNPPTITSEGKENVGITGIRQRQEEGKVVQFQSRYRFRDGINKARRDAARCRGKTQQCVALIQSLAINCNSLSDATLKTTIQQSRLRLYFSALRALQSIGQKKNRLDQYNPNNTYTEQDIQIIQTDHDEIEAEYKQVRIHTQNFGHRIYRLARDQPPGNDRDRLLLLLMSKVVEDWIKNDSDPRGEVTFGNLDEEGSRKWFKHKVAALYEAGGVLNDFGLGVVGGIAGAAAAAATFGTVAAGVGVAFGVGGMFLGGKALARGGYGLHRLRQAEVSTPRGQEWAKTAKQARKRKMSLGGATLAIGALATGVGIAGLVGASGGGFIVAGVLAALLGLGFLAGVKLWKRHKRRKYAEEQIRLLLRAARGVGNPTPSNRMEENNARQKLSKLGVDSSQWDPSRLRIDPSPDDLKNVHKAIWKKIKPQSEEVATELLDAYTRGDPGAKYDAEKVLTAVGLNNEKLDKLISKYNRETVIKRIASKMEG